MATYGTFTAVDSRAYSTGITIMELQTTSSQMICVTRAWCTQSSSTTSAQQRIEILRKTANATLTNALTPGKVSSTSQAASTVTAKSTATAEGTAGDILVEDSFNVLQGWLWIPSCPEERIWVPPSSALALKFPAAPGSSITFSYGMEWIELA